MEDLQEFMPTSKEVLVGTDRMVVNTLSVAKRDAVAKVLLGNLDVAKLVKPIMDNIRNTREMSVKVVEAIKSNELEAAKSLRDEAATSSVDIAEIITQIKSVVQALLTEDMTMVSCIILDVLENRQKVKGVSGEVAKDGKYNFEYNGDMFAHIRESLTPVQEFQVFKAAMEVNDLLGLAKNYWTLVVSNMTTGEDETETETPTTE